MAGRRHPYGIKFFGVDLKRSPTFEMIYFFELVTTGTACLFYIPFINMFASFILFGIALIRIFKERLRNIAEPFDPNVSGSEPNNELIEKRFRQLVEYHKRIIRYVAELNAIVSTVCLVEIIIFGALLCLLLFLVQIVERGFALGVCIAFIGCILFQLLTLYWLANELIEQVRTVLKLGGNLLQLNPIPHTEQWIEIGDLRQSLVQLQHKKSEDGFADDVKDAAPDGDHGGRYCSDYFADFSVNPIRVLLVFHYSSAIAGVIWWR